MEQNQSNKENLCESYYLETERDLVRRQNKRHLECIHTHHANE